MPRRRSLRHLLPQIIARDGGLWRCHYCGCELVPYHTRKGDPLYYEWRETVSIREHKIVWDYFLREGFALAVIDHKHPLSRGGSNHVNNLVAACWTCNQAKLSTPYKEFIASLHP